MPITKYVHQIFSAAVLLAVPAILLGNYRLPHTGNAVLCLFLALFGGQVIAIDLWRVCRYIRFRKPDLLQRDDLWPALRCISGILLLSIEIATLIWDTLRPSQFPIEIRSAVLAICLPLSYLSSNKLFDWQTRDLLDNRTNAHRQDEALSSPKTV